MKEAMWGVGLIVICAFGIFLVNIFGNITVTNQQDYTAMTNTVEAAMNDAKDEARYRSGFCVCSNKQKVDGKWVFKDSSEYEIHDVVNNTCPAVTGMVCEYIQGQYKIDKKVFAESLVRRFSQSVKANNDYKLIIKDVIEYPPKVSVLVQARAENNYQAVGGDYKITNQIDAVLESFPHVLPTPTPTPTPIPTPVPTPPPTQPPSNTTTNYNQGNTQSRGGTVTVRGSVKDKKSSSGAGCFLAGTKIKIPNGYKDIDKMFIGDLVLTYNSKIQKNEYKRIVNVFKFDNMHEELYTIKAGDVEFSLTSQHTVYTYRDYEYKYIPAKKLIIGDIVRDSNGEEYKITEINHKPIIETVYNLETEGNHNFYIGYNEILVHNMSYAQIGVVMIGPNKGQDVGAGGQQ